MGDVRDYPYAEVRAKHGRAIWWLLATVAAAVVLWFVLAGGPRPHTSAATPNASHTLPTSAETVALAAGAEQRPANAALTTANRFDGRGRLRGELTLSPRLTMPAQWSLILEPHPWLAGRDRARRVQVDYSADQREFVVEDLPLAAYLVRAQAAGCNSTRADVVLVRTSPDSHVVLRLDPPGLIDGEVIDTDHAAAEGVLVVLESSDKLRRETRTNPAGYWRFDEVIDGSYTVWFGRPETPLLQPFAVDFAAPTLRFPKKQLPVAGSLTVQVVDDAQAPQAEVAVTGFGEPQGSFRGTTDVEGYVREPWLWPGFYRLEARASDGRVIDATVLVDPRSKTQHIIRLPRAP